MLEKSFRRLMNHKKLTVFSILAGGGLIYYIANTSPADVPTRYILGTATKQTIVATVSGSGQVSAAEQFDITSKVSGMATKIIAQPGKEIRSGDVIMTIDSRTAQKAVRDAALSYQSAALSLQKLKEPTATSTLIQAQNTLAQAQRDYEDLIKPPDQITLLQAQNALLNAQDTVSKTNADLAKTYDDSFSAVSTFFVDAPTIMTGLYNELFGHGVSAAQQNIDFYRDGLALSNDYASAYRLDLISSYQATKQSYDTVLALFKTTSRFSPTSTQSDVVIKSSDLAKKISETVKNYSTFIRQYQENMTSRSISFDPFSTTQLTTLDGYTSKISSHITNLFSLASSLTTTQESLRAALRTVTERQTSVDDLLRGADANKIAAARERVQEARENLAKLTSGADTLDIKTQQLSLAQRAAALADARETLQDYTIRAPISGKLAKISVIQRAMISSGAAIATVIADRQIVSIPLNEVDVAKVHIGNKATVTFDAVTGLSLTGEVVEIDTIGTVSQGVVTYNVKIAFDTNDSRVRPGMSATAAIITEVKHDVISVVSSAIKTRGTESYVEVPSPTEQISNTTSSSATGVILQEPIQRIVVETGLSNATITEIKSGLDDGHMIIIRTITPSASKTTSNATVGVGSILSGGNRGFGGGTTNRVTTQQR